MQRWLLNEQGHASMHSLCWALMDFFLDTVLHFDMMVA